MHILVTGANGFVGRALVARLAGLRQLKGRTIERLTSLDLGFSGAPRQHENEHRISVDLADMERLNQVLDQTPPVDVVFHLASVPGGTAEAQYSLARRVNLDATLALLERGKTQAERGLGVPRFVFASSIAAFGPLHEGLTEETVPKPHMTYGAHKVIGEVLISDFSRRGWVDGISLRLPGVLVRPPARTGQLSAFLSDIIRELAAGRGFTCPMRADATTWASSLPNVIDNLLHASELGSDAQEGRNVFCLPTSCFSMAELVRAVGRTCKVPAETLVRYEPDARIEALFGGMPRIDTPIAEAFGFRSDADLDSLVIKAL